MLTPLASELRFEVGESGGGVLLTLEGRNCSSFGDTGGIFGGGHGDLPVLLRVMPLAPEGGIAKVKGMDEVAEAGLSASASLCNTLCAAVPSVDLR